VYDECLEYNLVSEIGRTGIRTNAWTTDFLRAHDPQTHCGDLEACGKGATAEGGGTGGGSLLRVLVDEEAPAAGADMWWHKKKGLYIAKIRKQ
jgi:hypothetical protein